MELNNIFNILDQIDLNDNEFKYVTFSQFNEPLLDNKIISRINKVAQLPSVVDIHMNTNGMLLSGKVADQLIDSGLTDC